MRAAGLAIAAALAGAPVASPPQPLNIVLAHGNAAEAKTRSDLLALAQSYDLAPWTRTRRIVIAQYAIPHSDPVLTLNTRSEGLVLLSAYVHEQLHRFEDTRPAEVDQAITELEIAYPGLPVGAPDGAANERSTYLHIITCYSEYQAMKRLVGPDRATAVISTVAQDHYRAIYRLVLAQEPALAAVIAKYRLMPGSGTTVGLRSR